MDFKEVRDNIQSFRKPWKPARRGVLLSSVQGALTRVGVERGELRETRLRLASEIFEREVLSFNDLTDGELDALHGWALRVNDLKQWLNKE